MKECCRDIPMPAPGRLAALVAAEAPACWLDSALPGHPRARHSLLALRPLRAFQAGAAELDARLQEWDAWLKSFRGDVASEAFFPGGLVGYLSYPAGRFSPSLPAAQFFLFDGGIRIDARQAKATVFSLGLRDDLSGADPVLAQTRCLELERLLRAAPEAVARAPRPASLNAELSREAYLSKVRDIRERILRGDCYQANFSQRFVAEGAWDPAELYLRLRSASPAPQMAFLNLGGGQILSASPETLLEVEGRRARSHPIKGTRPRGKDPETDRRLARELLGSAKDAAELLMIVDLVRNDLGRVCETGSIRVPVLSELDSLPQVHHLVATVEGLLRKGVGPLEALGALSPGGSITGAPKLKAMEILQELEAGPRGIYTGSIGYAGLGGRAAFNIAIRSAWLSGGRLEYSAGGGIVADSEPEAEYAESLHKARGFFEALGAEPPPA
ncbi:MAG: anthranilate synthase component I family protein [Deltaproteobacteria bacterium]|nr:anthranilate synthase component I family protein [Deltaproteobacteria bacterium]